MVRLGIDLGGTKIEIAALDESGRVIARHRRATPQGSYGETLNAIADLVARVEEEIGCRASVGVGTPGSLSPATGLLRNSNSVCLNNKPLLEDMERLLARPVRMANDANCLVLSEAADGAGAGARVVFGVILGTGVGGAIATDGRVLFGANAIAGEWGHNPLPWPRDEERPGPPCYCGKDGCIETFISGPAMAADHKKATGKTLTPPDIASLAEAGDSPCRETMERYADRLARALAHVINIVDPDVIVLGGGLSNVGRPYTEVPALWGAYVFSDRVNTLLVPARHGDSSGVLGAARLWPVEEGQ
jgi:fructokinase